MALFRHELAGKPLADDVDYAALAAPTGGYSAADIAAVCRNAAVAAAKDAAARGERIPITMARLQEHPHLNGSSKPIAANLR